MKKTLIAICVTLLLAAPIQLASAATSTTTEGTTVKQTTKYKIYQYKWSSKKPTSQPSTNNSQKNNSNTTAPTTTTTTQPSTNATDVNAFEQEVVKLTNAERTKAGLAPFQTDEKLMAAAREKSQDMQSKNYFSHTSPTFGSPFDRMKALGISYKSAGENIAKGQRTPQEVVQAWMDSPGHRANILNADFTHIGVGFVETGYHWTQQFIKK
ncbi:hypothetical protein AEA09_07655 [Lysinibacillus contaminans]|uniref:SCP domain-containing protein n=1 Tax=Lysinibacillus contaminans TaxID=1293441 RepID=A0ABR5K0Q5_9BACI|nr:CAP domain-containing protein [Lysinibacillus contaminans]KOS68441.1 hypothetical protein AEA09_07655 [Lysinibacillus contaminans]